MTTDIPPTGGLLVTSIFLGAVSSRACSGACKCCTGMAQSQGQHTLWGNSSFFCKLHAMCLFVGLFVLWHSAGSFLCVWPSLLLLLFFLPTFAWCFCLPASVRAPFFKHNCQKQVTSFIFELGSLYLMMLSITAFTS